MSDSISGLVKDNFIVKHREFNDILLTRATIIGDMGGGKTVIAEILTDQINRLYKEYKQINIYTNHYAEVHRIHEREEYAEIYKKLQNSEIINLIIDDALTDSHASKRSKQIDIDFARIRHYFKDHIKGPGATLNVFFVTQRYQLLAAFMRKAPILLVKATELNYFEDRQIYMSLGAKLARYLKVMAYDVLIKKKKAAMQDVIVKVVGKEAELYTLDYEGRAQFDKLLVPTSLTFQEELVGKLLVYLKEEQGLSLREIGRNAEISKSVVHDYYTKYSIYNGQRTGDTLPPIEVPIKEK